MQVNALICPQRPQNPEAYQAYLEW